MSLAEYLSGLQTYVDDIVEEGRAPAASVAIAHRGQIYKAAAGVLNLETRLPASTDTLFQIGSITKAVTASIVMLLVDDGRLDLDAPLISVWPGFRVADLTATRSITLRQLLSHTSGLESDIYAEEYWDDGGAIARYVDRCFLLPQVHEQFGRKFSYSNAAYTLAGRLIEIVTGMPWARAVDEYVYKPLGLRLALSSPLQTLRFSATMGHMYRYEDGAARGSWQIAPFCYLPLGMAPAGATLSIAAGDLVKFGLAHLAGGKSADGRQWMSEKSVCAMRELQITLPGQTSLFETGWGIGWSVSEIESLKMFGHSGGALGHQAVLQMIPELDVVFCFQANGMTFGGSALVPRVLTDLFSCVLGVNISQPTEAVPTSDLDQFQGTYGSTGKRYGIDCVGDHLEVQVFNQGLSIGTVRFRLVPAGAGRFHAYAPSGESWGPAEFTDPNEAGRAQYFFFGHRLNRRVQS